MSQDFIIYEPDDMSGKFITDGTNRVSYFDLAATTRGMVDASANMVRAAERNLRDVQEQHARILFMAYADTKARALVEAVKL